MTRSPSPGDAPSVSEPVSGAAPPFVPFDRTLRERMTRHLARHEIRTEEPSERRHAAVALVVLDSDPVAHGDDPTEIDRMQDLSGIPGTDISTLTGRVDGTAGGAALLLTRRGGHLPSHARQWAFPGGRIDPGETPLDAALRELDEEVGLTLSESSLLGRLDDYPTRSGYLITPYVFWVDDDQEPVPDPGEVASVHRVGLHELTRPDSPRFVSIPESDRPVVQMPIGGDLIHAPTGALMYQFRAVAIDGETVRVHDLEEPVFAWR